MDSTWAGTETLVEDDWRGISEAACGLVERSGNRPFSAGSALPRVERGPDSLNRICRGFAGVSGPRRNGAGQTVTIFGPRILQAPSREAKLFGGPGSLSEGGVRIPGFWHWPGVIEPGLTIHEIAQNVDLFVTLTALAGADVPGDRLIDGMNLSALLRNQRPEYWPNRDIGNVVIRQRNRATARMSFRTTNWLAVRYPDAGAIRGWPRRDVGTVRLAGRPASAIRDGGGLSVCARPAQIRLPPSGTWMRPSLTSNRFR